MNTINQELLAIVQQEATHLDEYVAGRAKRFNINLSGVPSRTVVSVPNENTISVVVFARPSIRYRDAGFGSGYQKGRRLNPESKAKKGKSRKTRKRANIINRLMFSMLHSLVRYGLPALSRSVVTSFSQLNQKS